MKMLIKSLCFILELFCIVSVGYQYKETVYVKQELVIVKTALKETEAECKRLTDTCIDIIANRRWENGDER